MSRRRGGVVAVLAAAAAALAAAGPASAHAYLIRTTPAASGVLNAPPASVQLTYDEPIEPRLAIISVTNANGDQEATGSPSRSPANPDTLAVPLRPHLPQGWYLIYWRAISVDGHPVQGAFTYAVGPDPGPAPQFPVPHVSASATTPGLLVTRWLMFAALMAAVGLWAFRLFVARPLARRSGREPALRPVTVAFAVAAALAPVLALVHLDVAIANDSLHSAVDLGATVPLFRVTAFGRAMVDLAILLAIFAAAGGVSVWLDRPDREHRSIAELAATVGAALAAVAVVIVPAAAGHPAQTSPRGLVTAADAVHLAGGAVWLGGLAGLLLLWRALPAGGRLAGLATVVPRFSPVALAAVVAIAATGTVETVAHMPALSALWDTGFGRAILVKTALLAVAVALASGNLLRTVPRLRAARADEPRAGAGAAAGAASVLLRTLLRGEVVVVVGLVFTGGLLSSLAPPPPAYALADQALASVGPGRVARTVTHGAYRLDVLVTPNKAAAPDSFALRITSGGMPVRGATVTLTFNHTQMQMPQQQYVLAETAPGVYSRANNSALVMVGRWALDYNVTVPGHAPFSALILDEAEG